ncbi:phage tail length tape measure family protein [Massilia sp. YIM B02763]|uniref:phage tail length tape measure family protein n=1 Tax=Massilia sp. YIM B02763 TaxID=3050130 RepID=UPI0025B6F574|nr:phage tail length tape measure family protein [Massilia sp. YIM B02763]MDN4052911.1 phage tail length tape measure family protein [Massilia sp. YIM B02763]
MTEVVNQATILVTADATGVEAGLRPAVAAAQQAGQAISRVGDGAAGASRSVETAGRSIVSSIQRATVALESGSRTSAAYFELLARQKGVDPSILAPYIAQLRAVEDAQARAAQAASAQQAAQQQTAEGIRAQAAAQRELAQAQATRDNFVASLREQIALFGASTEQAQRYRAAQIGASQAAEPLIAQLQAMRSAQEQAAQAQRDSAEAARQQAAAQRELAQAQASRDAFLSSLREQIALTGRTTEETLRYRAAQLGVSQQASALILQLENMRAAQDQVAAAARAQAQAQREAVAAQGRRDSFIADLQQQADAIGRTRTELLELRAAQLGVANQAAPLIAQLRAAENGLNHTGMSARATAAAMRGVPAQLTDIVVSLQGGQAPLTVLLQQGGQLRDMFGSVGGAARALGSSVLGLINPYTVAAAAVGALAYAYYKGSKEVDAYNRSIILSGNAAGTTASQLADTAREISKSVGTQGDAAAALAELAGTGAVSSRNLKQFGEVAVQAQKYIGRSVEDTAKDFAELGKSPVEASLKLDQAYNYLTVSVLDQIKALERQGRVVEAGEIAQRAYATAWASRSEQMKESLGTIQRAWMDTKDAASKAWDEFLGIGRKKTTGEQLADVRRQIALAKQAPIDTSTIKGYGDEMRRREAKSKLPSLEKEESKLQKDLDAENLQAQQKERETALKKASAAWDVIMEGALSRADAKKRRVTQITEAAKAAGTYAKPEDLKAALRKVDQEFESLDNPALAKAEGQREVAKAALAGELQNLESRHKQLLMSEAEYIAQKRDLQLKEADIDIAGIRARAQHDKGKEDQSAYQKDIADLQVAVQRRKNIIDGAKNDTDELGTARKKAVADLVRGWDDTIASESAATSIEVDLFGKSSQARAVATAQMKLDVDARKLIDDQKRSGHPLTESEIADLNKETAARKEKLAAVMNERAAIAAASQLRDQNRKTAAESISDPAARQKALLDIEADQWRDLIASAKEGSEAQKKLKAEFDTWYANGLKVTISEADVARAKGLLDIMSALDDSAKSAAEGMANSFGKVGAAIGELTTALSGYQRTQAAIAAKLASDKLDARGDESKIQKANATAAEASAQAQMKSYGDVAGAAKSFFDENSKGYKIMGAVEKAYHAASLVMNVELMAQKLFATNTVTTAKATANAIEIEGAATTTGVVLGAESAKSTAYGVTALAAALAAPFPANIPAFATVAAMLAAIGVAIGGAGGAGDKSLSQQRQETQGTGTVLGDSSAKSESIQRALDAVEKNTYQGLAINTNMLVALRSIDNNIVSFASQLVQSTDVTGKYAATTGTMGGFVGKIVNGLFGGKTSVQDTGFTLDPTSLGAALAQGVQAYQYSDMHKSGGLFGSSKNWTDKTALGDEANRQFGQIIGSLASSITDAGGLLGLSGKDFTDKLDSFVIDIGKVSLKDLKGDELQKELQAVFSKLGDNLAQFAVGGLEGLQKVGEGYLETLVRIGTEYQTVDVVFQSFGKTFGMVGVASAEARDRLVQLAGGLDEFTSQGEYFLTNFFSDKEQAEALRARIEPTLAKNGLSSVGDDVDKLFRNFVVGLDTTTKAGAETYTELMAIAPALKTIVDAQKDVLDERTDLQEQLDELTLTSSQLQIKQREKERAALDASNRALYDQVKALEDQKAAIEANKDAASTLLGGVDGAYSVLQKVVAREKSVLQERIDKETEAVNRLKSLSDSIHSTLDSMKVPGTELFSRHAAQAQIRGALATVRGGAQLSDDQIKSLGQAFSTVSQDSTKLFASKDDYLFDLLTTRNDIAQLGDITDDQLTNEEKSLKELQDQTKALDATLEKYQEQIDILKGISTIGLSIEDAIRGLNLSISLAQQNSAAGAASAINGAYQQYLGRAPDQAGFEWWQNAAAGGTPTSQIVDGIKNSTEANLKNLYESVLGRAPDAEGLAFWMNAYGPTMSEAEKADFLKGAKAELDAKAAGKQDDWLKEHGVPGYASGGMFGGGLRIVGEDGPELEATGPARIWSSNQTAALLSRAANPSENSAALAETVRTLNATVATLKEANADMARDMKTMAQALKDASPNGQFLRVKVVNN